MKINKTTLVLILFLVICSSSILCKKNDIPRMITVSEELKRVDLKRNLPFFVIDSSNNIFIMYGQDEINAKDRTLTGDGIFDKVVLNIYDKQGNHILKNKCIISSEKAILGIAALLKDKELCLIWKDVKNNQDFSSGNHNTYDCDLYYKTVNIQGEIIKSGSKLTTKLVDQYAADTIKLDLISGVSISDLNSYYVILDRGKDKQADNSLVIFDSKKNKHLIKIEGNHLNNICKIIYSKANQNNNLLIQPKEVAIFHKKSEQLFGPDITSIYIEQSKNDNIHIVWELNDGANFMNYYYLRLNNIGQELIYENIGSKFANDSCTH